MRQGLYGGVALLTAAVALAGPPAARAEDSPTDVLTGGPPGPGSLIARGQMDSTYQVPFEPSEKIPIPTGNPGTHGFYTFAEFMYLTTTWTLGDQTVAYRGLVDATGAITQVPGTYIGSRQVGLSTDQFGRRSWLPGYNIGVGYKTDDGISVYASYLQTFTHHYNAGATSAAPFFRSARDLSDTYLVSGVFNFPQDFAGQRISTLPEQQRGGNIFYGIWNGASNMEIQFDQWFDQAEIGGRVPLLQTEYSRVYGLAGGRFNWFMERFMWRTVEVDPAGNAGPMDAARYNNTLSQRMYGPFFGCGHEVYVGKRFSISSDITGAMLIDLIKERAKYKLETNTIQNKRSVNDYSLVPSATANINLWWYPIEGVQLRVGYNAWTFFNTRNMLDPIGFNYGAIDPNYNTQVFRIVHGLNFGVGLFF